MEIEKQIVAFVLAAICFSFVFIAQAALPQQPQQAEFNKLNNILNKVDQRWPSTAASQYSVPRRMPPPATPTPQAFSSTYSNYMRPGMPYSAESIPALQHSAVWRMLGNAMRAGGGGAMAGQAAGNPFNLSPFGILHYLWDDTTYVSAANPVTLYQTQNELQSAQHYSQMAQAASSRVRYARNPQEREEAARQAQYYADMAKQAAQQAQEVSESGSLNPAEVAQAAMQQAQSAEQSASQANRYAYRGF